MSEYWRGFSVRQDLFKGRTAHTKCGLYLLGPSLAAALPAERRLVVRRGWAGETSGLFEHPAGMVSFWSHVRATAGLAFQHSFSVDASRFA